MAPKPFAFALLLVLFAGCATTDNSGGIIGNIPPGSRLSRVSIGMSMRQVHNLIGAPTDTKTYVTGKSWIPFYFGTDSARSESLYRGEGRITFTGGAGFGGGAFTVYRIVYDPTEDGFSR